jgi:tetratricopeptide (TPR) repeat protein
MAPTAAPEPPIVATFQRILAEAGPRQAEVLRACAVPRWLDLGVLGVLRGREDGNERVLDLLRGYSFVRPLGEGRYAYQDEVRAALLGDWRDQRPNELRALNRRLSNHFARRAAAAVQDEYQLPNATIAVRPKGDWALWEREALYHQLMADPPSGLTRLRAAFDQAEATYRLADAEALLQTARDAPIDAAGLLWLRYLRARLDRLALRLDAAAEQLNAILAAAPTVGIPSLDPLLAAEARLTLGEVLAETGQWAKATALYQRSLAYFEQAGDRQKAAEVMLRLGDAYHGLSDDIGGWHVPDYPQGSFWRALGQLWSWLQSLPFGLLVFVLRLAGVPIPQAKYLGPYQNWPLIWLYRTAQHWYRRALIGSQALGDEAGVLRAEQQLAEIERLFGYPADALARLDQLRARPAAQSPYRQAWIERGRAAALLDQGEIGRAQALLAPVLAYFREVGDFRGEAAVLALQGRAAADAGRAADALANYRDSLARFRAIGYAEAREQALYDLRAWRRRLGTGEISRQIGALLAEEPEKRYVARFPSSKISLLQALSLVALPLALLLTAVFSSTIVLQRLAGSQALFAQAFYDPLRTLIVLAVLIALYILAYTLVALVVIFFVPLNNLEREQPDYLITSATEIAHYDNRGMLVQRLPWDAVRRWMRFDQNLWARPLPLFSGTLLVSSDRRNVTIDGITGWYTSLQEDIGQRLSAAGNPSISEAWGFNILRSKSGALFALGTALLLLFISGQNEWAGWLYFLLPPSVYAALGLLAFSGALLLIPLAYWLAARPLAWVREFLPGDRWPYFVGATGLAAVGLYIFGGGEALPVPALNIGILLWGTYLFADALTTVLLPKLRWARLLMIAAALLAAVALAAPPATAFYYKNLGKAYLKTGNYTAAGQAYRQSLEFLSPNQRGAAADSWNNFGVALYQQKQYRAAAEAYSRAAELLLQEPASAERNQYVAALLYNRSWARRQIGDPNWSQDIQSSCAASAAFCRDVRR